MQILNGKEVAQAVRGAQRHRRTEGQGLRAPGLAVVLVGDDSASQVYVGSKIKACKETGIEASVSSAETYDAGRAKRPTSKMPENTHDGILVQLPLPPPLDSAKVIEMIPPEKER